MTTDRLHRGKVVVLILLSAVLVFLWSTRVFNRRDPDAITNESSPTNSEAEPGATRVALRSSALKESTDPYEQLFDEEVPLEVRRILASSARCAKLIAQERRGFAKNSPGDRLLHGLQRKLFVDDYAYACLLTDKLDPEKAGKAYDEVTRKLEGFPDQPPVSGGSGNPRPTDSVSVERMQEKYAEMLNSQNPGYSNVLTLVAGYNASVLNTDLFKDALSYVGLQTEVRQWIDVELEDTRKSLAKLRTGIKDAARLASAVSGLEDLSQGMVNDFQRLQASYRTVFTFRMVENHGMDGVSAVQNLDQANLPGAGPELTIPRR